MPPQRRYICSFCARAFSRSEHRARHERSHTKEKPFGCDKCDSAFVRRDLLQRHLRTVHAKDKKKEPRSAPPESTSTPCSSNASSPREPCSIVTMDNSQLYKFNEQNIISLLTLSQKFNKVSELSLDSKISSFFLVWGTMSNLNLPVVKTDQILTLDETSNLFYALLAFGAADSNQFGDCLKLLNKSWMLILKSSKTPLEIVQSLTIIANIYVMNYQTLKRLNTDTLIPIETILEYLDQSTQRILETPHEPLFNYWYIFLILSNFAMAYNKKPPVVHQLFLHKTLPLKDTTLLDTLDSLARTAVLPTEEVICSDCVIMGLSNELQALKYNQPCSFQSKPFLHNAIIMANRSFIQQSASAMLDGDDPDVLNNLIMISKRNLLLNCPLKFQDPIVDYIIVPKSQHHWNLLNITLKEFNFEHNSNNWQQLLQDSSSEDVTNACVQYFGSVSVNSINNNLGLISHPLLFIGFLSNSNIKSDFNSLLNLPPNFTLSVIENYLVLIKIFADLNNTPDTLNNAILQSIIYLIHEMGSSSTMGVQHEIASVLRGSPIQVSNQFIQYFTKNLHQNLLSWITSTYSGVNKREILDGITGMIDCLPVYSSPIQSCSSSPRQRYSPLSFAMPIQNVASSTPQKTSGLRHSLETKITLPPINMAGNDSRERLLFQRPYGQHQGYRYGY